MILAVCSALIFISYIWLSYRTDGVTRINVIEYITTVITFFGWILLVIFGGYGLSALPIDLIISFVNRPKIVKKLIIRSKVMWPDKKSKSLFRKLKN